MTVASERAGCLVVGKEEDDIGFFGSLRRASQQKTKGDDEFFHIDFSLFKKKALLANYDRIWSG
jgi:hypothetical protein